MLRLALALLITAVGSVASAASITDLTQWTQIEDPPHPNVFTVNRTPNEISLRAEGAVPSGTDIGYASVDGQQVAGSTDGYYFDPSSDFAVAIDFDLTSTGSMGAGGIGLGIGEDIDGKNSAGAALAFANGTPLLFASASRIDDTNQPIESIVAGFGRGRLFVDYEAASGDVTLGVNATPGSPTWANFVTLNAIQNQWNDEPLLVSFFLRSQAASLFTGLSSGQVDAVFSNFEVLSGSPIGVPEPSTAILATLALLASWRFPSRR